MYSVPTEIIRKTDSFSECYMHTQTRTIRDEALVATAMSPVNPYSCVQIEEHACITLVWRGRSERESLLSACRGLGPRSAPACPSSTHNTYDNHAYDDAWYHGAELSSFYLQESRVMYEDQDEDYD